MFVYAHHRYASIPFYMVPLSVPWQYNAGAALLMAPQVYWFSLICRGAFRLFTRASRHKAAKSSKDSELKTSLQPPANGYSPRETDSHWERGSNGDVGAVLLGLGQLETEGRWTEFSGWIFFWPCSVGQQAKKLKLCILTILHHPLFENKNKTSDQTKQIIFSVTCRSSVSEQ